MEFKSQNKTITADFTDSESSPRDPRSGGRLDNEDALIVVGVVYVWKESILSWIIPDASGLKAP